MVFDPISLAVGGAGLVTSFLSGKSAKRKQRRAEKYANNILNTNKGLISSGFSDAEESLFDAFGLTGQGFDTAIAELGTYGGAARQAITDQGDSAFASERARLERSGFASGNLVSQLHSGISGQVGRGLASVEEDLGGMYAELLSRKGIAQAEIASRLSNLYVQRTGAYLSNERDRFNYFSGITRPDYQGTASDLGGLGTFLKGFGLGD